MRKLKDTLRRFDMFGMPISLRFDGGSLTHTTVPGGILTMFLHGIFLYHLYTLFQKCLIHGQDFDKFISDSIDW